MYFLSIIVLCFLFLQTFGRPTHVLEDYDKDSKDNSYRDSDGGDTEDYLQSEQKSSLHQFSGNDHTWKAELLGDNSPSTNEEVDHARHDKDYLENDEDQADAAHLSHNNMNVNNDVKRTATYSNGMILFHNNEKPLQIRTHEYNEDDRTMSNQRAQYLKRYNSVHNTEKDTLNRERREIKSNDLNERVGIDEISTQKNELNANENEETAIRRHVKKLSKDELDELLHSLTEDKRTLLKNIMDNNQQEYDSINKREITKKAGANEENSFVGSEQSDTSKIQVGSANLEAESSMTPNFEKQDSTKKPDTESMYSKSPDMANSSEKTNDKINVLDSVADKSLVNSDNLENFVNSETDKETPKKENKREIDSKYFAQSESIINEPALLKSSNNDDLYCSDNEELSQLWRDESNLSNDNRYKREVCSDDLDSMKSLEDSFPNLDNTNNYKSESDMTPLVRVKRNNPEKIVDKRNINAVSNLKVPYFSSVLENNEEGSDEGGEFQEDGFFDRDSNFAKAGELAKRDIDISKGNGENNIKYCGNSQSGHMVKNKLDTDTASLGSDTDVVVSGIEGVDDNMMYNSVARIRRTSDAFDNLNMEGENSKFKLENKQQLRSQNEDNEIPEEYNNAARYQENDAFGSLPRNYEQDLGRFKRIRRLKPENNIRTAK